MAKIVAPKADAPVRRRLASDAKAGSESSSRVAGEKRPMAFEPAQPDVEETAPATNSRSEVQDVDETLNVEDVSMIEPAETEPSEAAAGKKKRRRKTSARGPDAIPDEVLPESPGASAPADKLDESVVAHAVVAPGSSNVVVFDSCGFRRSRSEDKDKYKWSDPGRMAAKDLKRWFQVTNCGRIPYKEMW